VSDQLAPHEKASFAVLSAVLTEQGEVDRDSVRVLVASRGVDLGRDYIRLRDLGLVEEVDARPGFLRRLFGAKAKRLVRLTERGMALARPEDAPIAAVAVKAGDPVERGGADPSAPEAVGEVVVAASVEAAVAPEAVVAAAVPETAAPAGTVQAQTLVLSQRRFTPADFTEAVGGAPMEDAPALPEGERLDGLAELLGLIGFELLPAGRLLAAHRWAEGFGDADVALEVLVVSVAHAARLNATGTARLEVGAMLAVVDAIGAALGHLVAEDALTAPQLAESLETMRVFVAGGAGAEAAIAALLDDPLRGLAPPAACPEGVWVPADDGEAQA
jgi:hypothetical protein